MRCVARRRPCPLPSNGLAPLARQAIRATAAPVVRVDRGVVRLAPFARQATRAAAVAMLSACATIHRPPASVPSLLADGDAARATARATMDSVVERLVRRSRDRDTLDILLLSGGGQSGAYGAGFMRGWRTRPRDPMPRFDLVTGISTGALQAPFALLATTEALDTLAQLYRSATARIAPRVDWFFWLRRTGGLVKADRLRATIDAVVDDSMGAALRREFRASRQLIVGTTDLDLGSSRAWDATTVLDSGRAGLAELRRVLLASAAIPGIFPPLVLERHVHSDGGVVGNIIPLLDVDDYRSVAARRAASGHMRPVIVRVYALVNNWPDSPPVPVKPSNRGGVTQRAFVTTFYALQQQQIRALQLTARVISADVPGVQMELRVSWVPQELATAPGAQALVDDALIRRLEQLGYDRARGDSAWDVVELPTQSERPTHR